ncbi:uncharacterized protein [Euwallacea similis]|uniref:uncharacterized protein n=1 Tax=Euwallacea similis TaxID=1736056 RepID=UPI00344ED214
MEPTQSKVEEILTSEVSSYISKKRHISVKPSIEPPPQKRQLLYGVIQSTLFYVAPIWGRMKRIKKYAHIMLRVQRNAFYCTVSHETSQVLEAMPPIHLAPKENLILSAHPRVEEANRRAAKSTAIQKRQDHMRLNYYLTQALSGHESFRIYTHRIGKTGPDCRNCGVNDTGEHCIFQCLLFEEQRETLNECVNNLTQTTLVKGMLESKTKWNHCSGCKVISGMVKVKERFERAATQEGY